MDQKAETSIGDAPTAAEIKTVLLERAERFAALTGATLARVGSCAAGDHRFFLQISAGERSCTIEKYGRVMAWFEANWPSDEAAA